MQTNKAGAMIILVRYSEIGLKGKNRPLFERKLVANIRANLRAQQAKGYNIQRKRGRIIISVKKKIDLNKLTNVFGIESLSPAEVVAANMDRIKEKAVEIAEINNIKDKTYRVTAKRLSKEFPITSPEINKIVGGYIQENTGAKVDLTRPDLNIQIEILKNKAYMFTKIIRGEGGLPVGIEGKVAVELENKYSLAAAWLLLKRGCKVTGIDLGKNIDFSKLKPFSEGEYEKPIKIQELREKDVQAVVENTRFEDLGSVKLENIKYGLPVLRPLIGWENNQIKEIFEKIGV